MRRMVVAGFVIALALIASMAFRSFAPAQPKPAAAPVAIIPHGQESPPGPALTPAQAVKKMKVPEGFSVEVVAAEPDLINPVAMTFDERGRVWVTESFEYPRHAAGPGRDRVKVFESTKGDGVYDKMTIFAEGLNIPSGIAVGHGGVWIANAPDILFYKEGPDGKAAGKPEVVVTGFGRQDTHELPNSLTWGPDGYLYGLNGVFNPSVVKQNGKEFRFTCALFRIHPRTREFQLFCEGTSNPWGVAWDTEGSAFISACVIDHLWHLVETGYYHRQGGAYPPFVWKLGSIVKHKHQKAAYCGIHYFDSDAYPAEYRDKLYMGNIHGNCINSDELTRDGATYFGKPRPDFLSANDKWFMPVVQKTGPDGCLYVLDWYDRYHCYQDANRDPKGIDREHGRLYRVRYKDTPRAGKFDLAKETDDELIQRLHSANVYFRDIAQRLLCERNTEAIRGKLGTLILDDAAPRKARMHALWARIGCGNMDTDLHLKLLAHKDPTFRAWGVRAAGNHGKVDAKVRDKVAELAADSSRDVQLQVVIAARKIDGIDPMPFFAHVLAACGDDKILPVIVWQNLHPLLEAKGDSLVKLLDKADLKKSPNLAALLPRAADRVLGSKAPDVNAVCALVTRLADREHGHADSCCQCLETLAARIETGEISGDRLRLVAEKVTPVIRPHLSAKADQRMVRESILLAAALKDPDGLKRAHRFFFDREGDDGARVRALNALIAAADRAETRQSLLTDLEPVIAASSKESSGFRGQVLASLARLDQPRVAELVLARYPTLEPELQPKAIELLTQRASWARALLKQVERKKVPVGAINVNQVKKMLALKDAELSKHVTAVWGTLREDRNPQREKIVADMRTMLKKTPGDPKAGMEVFKKLCAQCHKIHGEGQDVGPDITSNGRSDFEQLLSNVFDPSLVIGAGYVATTITTTKGLVVTGLVVEDTPQRIVLKQQGGKLETIPRKDVDEVVVSKISLMPEDVEKQLKPQEIADLFAFLCLDKPPSDPRAKRIPGTPPVKK